MRLRPAGRRVDERFLHRDDSANPQNAWWALGKKRKPPKPTKRRGGAGGHPPQQCAASNGRSILLFSVFFRKFCFHKIIKKGGGWAGPRFAGWESGVLITPEILGQRFSLSLWALPKKGWWVGGAPLCGVGNGGTRHPQKPKIFIFACRK